MVFSRGRHYIPDSTLRKGKLQSGEFHCQLRNGAKELRQKSCYTSGRLVQQQQSQLFPKVQLNEQDLTTGELWGPVPKSHEILMTIATPHPRPGVSVDAILESWANFRKDNPVSGPRQALVVHARLTLSFTTKLWIRETLLQSDLAFNRSN